MSGSIDMVASDVAGKISSGQFIKSAPVYSSEEVGVWSPS